MSQILNRCVHTIFTMHHVVRLKKLLLTSFELRKMDILFILQSNKNDRHTFGSEAWTEPTPLTKWDQRLTNYVTFKQ